MEYQKNELEEKLLKKRQEAEQIKTALEEAAKKEEEVNQEPLLSLEEVTEQMGKGMVSFPDAPVRFRLVTFFEKRLSLPLPVDYLKRHTTKEDMAVLVNEAIGISLTLQLTHSSKKHVTFEEVKKGTIGQLKAAGIYVELLEEGEVEDELAPVYFMTYRMPTPQGVLYNMVFYAINRRDGAMVMGNYNCFYKDIEKWENIIKATITYMNFC